MSDKSISLLRDFLYFDHAKAVSVFSQIESHIASYETGTEYAKSRILHHELFAKTEKFLFEGGYAMDVSNDITPKDIFSGFAHAQLETMFYLRAEGWAVIEDYSRIKNISQRFHPISDLIEKAICSSIEKTEEIRQIEEHLASLRAVRDSDDADKIIRLKALEEELKERLREFTGIRDVPRWLMDGIGEFVDTFMSDRIMLRIYPFESLPSFHIISNLKRDCFVDGDLENILFAYGTRPSVKLSVFGLITSVPSYDDILLNPLDEFESEKKEVASRKEQTVFEKGFYGAFKGFEQFEKFARFSRYPNVTIFPIAVYRNISLPHKLDAEQDIKD